MRSCEACGNDISHKRKDARFCDRKCKTAKWHVENRATDSGKELEKQRNKLRYAREAVKRRASAKRYYYEHQKESVEYSRNYRKNNPERRRDADARRAMLMVGNPGYLPFTNEDWLKLCNRHRHQCAYCGTKGPLERDHVIPLSRGGRHAIANILPACSSCNGHKGALFLSEWRRS